MRLLASCWIFAPMSTTTEPERTAILWLSQVEKGMRHSPLEVSGRLHLMRNDFMLDMQKGSEDAMVQIELILVFDQSPAS